MECKIIKEVNSSDFKNEVLNAKLPVFICFTTSWCRTCLPSCLMADKLADKYDGKVKFVKIDKEKSSDIAKMYDVTVVPTIMIFNNGSIVKKIIGYQRQTDLIKMLDAFVSANKFGIAKEIRINADKQEELLRD